MFADALLAGLVS